MIVIIMIIIVIVIIIIIIIIIIFILIIKPALDAVDQAGEVYLGQLRQVLVHLIL